MYKGAGIYKVDANGGADAGWLNLSEHVTANSNLYTKPVLMYSPSLNALYYKDVVKVYNSITNIDFPSSPNFATFDQYLSDLISGNSFTFAVYDVGKVMSANIRLDSRGMFIKVGTGYSVASGGYVAVYSPVIMVLS